MIRNIFQCLTSKQFPFGMLYRHIPNNETSSPYEVQTSSTSSTYTRARTPISLSGFSTPHNRSQTIASQNCSEFIKKTTFLILYIFTWTSILSNFMAERKRISMGFGCVRGTSQHHRKMLLQYYGEAFARIMERLRYERNGNSSTKPPTQNENSSNWVSENLSFGLQNEWQLTMIQEMLKHEQPADAYKWKTLKEHSTCYACSV